MLKMTLSRFLPEMSLSRMKILRRLKVSTLPKITHTKTCIAKFIQQRRLKVSKSQSLWKISWTERRWHIMERTLTFQHVSVRYLGNKSEKLKKYFFKGKVKNISGLTSQFYHRKYNMAFLLQVT